MRVKRFIAPTVQAAAAQVRTEFGPDAVILHTRKTRRSGGLAFWRRPMVEVIAAVDTNRAPQPPAIAGEGAVPLRRDRHVGDAPRPNGVERPSSVGTALLEVQREIAAIRRVLVERTLPAGGAQAWPGALQALYDRLLSRDVTPTLAAEVVTAVQRATAPSVWEEPRGVWQEATRILCETLRCDEPREFGERPVIVPLVGPTGVGKTTTIAKLAANWAVAEGRRVALITVDTYRIAAVEQLRTYADIMGLSIDVALSPQDLRDALARRREADVVLVDTAGRSHRNALHMVELKGFLEVIDGATIHLVLSAATRLNDLLGVVEEFGIVPCQRLIVTKLDETQGYGVLYNLARLTGKPIAYVTNGQSVPDDIEAARPEKLAAWVLGEAP